MAQLKSNGLDIEYDTFGDVRSDPMLLVMGLGTQMIAWPPDFCDALAKAGHYVIRFDNRDVGLSSKLDGLRAPSVFRMLLNSYFGVPFTPPYTLDDMALDAVGVLDALGIDSAHVIGASMGGMIAQIMAVSHPNRVKTLTSVMSSSGNPKLPKAPFAVRKQLFMTRPKSNDREEIVEHSLKSFRMIMSPAYPRTDDELRALIIESLERSHYLPGFLRHAAANLADGSRVDRLKKISQPTLVIHGKEDPLLPAECGFDTALHVRGARLELIDGMGHDFPPPLIKPIASLILGHTRTPQRPALSIVQQVSPG